MTVPRSEMITYLVPGQVAELLEVSENTVYRRAKQDPSGELPASHRARLSSNRFRRQGSGDVNVRLRWDDQASYYRGTARPISTSLRLRLSIPQGTEPAVCPCGHRAGRHCGRGLLPDLGVSRSPAMKLPALRRGGQRDDDVILASGDPVAMDVVVLGLLKSAGRWELVIGKDVWEQRQIRRAVALGLGARGPADVALVAEDLTPEDRGFRELLDSVRREVGLVRA